MYIFTKDICLQKKYILLNYQNNAVNTNRYFYKKGTFLNKKKTKKVLFAL